MMFEAISEFISTWFFPAYSILTIMVFLIYLNFFLCNFKKKHKKKTPSENTDGD